jgi:hypothetical protein
MCSLAVLGMALLGYMAFAFRWPKIFRSFAVCPFLMAPNLLCIGLLELVRYHRGWQVVVTVILSAISCVLVYFTLLGRVHGHF